MQLEVKDIGTIRVRDVKANIRSGVISPETPVRYHSNDEWVELCEFLNDWMKSKATLPQNRIFERVTATTWDYRRDTV
jgi:hypothetical protein